MNQSNCIGCAHHLRLKEFRHALARIVGLSRIPFDQELLPLRFGQQRQIGHRLRQIGDHSVQHALKVTEHSRDGRALDPALVVADLERHFRSAVDVCPEGKLGLIADGKFPLLPPTTLRA